MRGFEDSRVCILDEGTMGGRRTDVSDFWGSPFSQRLPSADALRRIAAATEVDFIPDESNI